MRVTESLISEQRIEEIWTRYYDTWSCKEPDRVPFKLTIPVDAVYKRTFPAYYENDDFMNYQLATIRKHYQEELMDDFLPIVYPPHDTGTVARAFGCKPFYDRGELPAFFPVIHKPEEIYKLKEPDLNSDEWFQAHLRRTKQIQEMLPSTYYVGLYDIQSPLDVGVLIWHYEDFLKAMYTNPKEIHLFLEIVTDTIIESVKLNLEVLDKPIPFGPDDVDLPMRLGIHMSDDMMAVLSPKLYEEFGTPYLTEISREFGAISLHSCGIFTHNIKNLAKIPNFRGIDYGQFVNINTEALIGFFGRSIVLHTGPGEKANELYGSTLNYFKYVSALKKRGKFILTAPIFPDGVKPKDLCDAILKELHSNSP